VTLGVGGSGEWGGEHVLVWAEVWRCFVLACTFLNGSIPLGVLYTFGNA
jgi:hypothetical protein